MTTPTTPAQRALQRVRDRHPAGDDGNCTECGKAWPCPTLEDVDGDPPDDLVATAINRARTVITAAEAQKPATVAEFKRLLRDAIDPPPPQPPPVEPPPPSEPPPGGTGPGKEPAVPRPVR
ncbi:hypothetical protein [Streptodolium elevatio]|uniref:Uncharacterized protein n=1 Tax=Streptodolium elevatio TaxID=3157996 RepID=A0ABV3DLG5_9ACTN